MWGLPPAGSPFGAPQGFWSLPLLSSMMGMVALSLEKLLQLWISKSAVLSDFPQPRGCLRLCSTVASGSGELTGLSEKLRVTGRVSSRATINGSQPAYHVL